MLSLVKEQGTLEWPGQGEQVEEDKKAGRWAEPTGRPRRLMWIYILSCESKESVERVSRRKWHGQIWT